MLTATLVAVGHAPGRAVVPSADDSLLPDDDAAHSAFHAVASQGCQVCELHEVLVPARPQACLICEVQGPHSVSQGGNGGGGVEQLQLCTLEQRAQPGALGKQVGVIAQDKVFERRRREVVDGAAVLEALPAHADWGVDADEEEEGPAEERVNDPVVPDVRRHPALSPSERDKVEQSVDVGKSVLSGGGGGGRGHVSVRGRLLDGGRGSGAG